MRRRVWVNKDSPRTTAGELQKIVESRGQKTFKKIVKQILHYHMLFGRVSIKMILVHPKTIFSIFSCQTRLQLQMGLVSMVRWNWKSFFFLQQTLKMGLVNIGIKSTPCVQWNILLYFWCCGPIFLLVLDILFRHMASWILSNTNR